LRDAGGFRPALYYRLASSRIEIPPLRERREDVLPLARTFLDALRQRGEADGEFLGPNAERILLTYHWPGNVRELRNAISAAVYAKGSPEMGHVGQFLEGGGGPDRLRSLKAVRDALGRDLTPRECAAYEGLGQCGRMSIAALARFLGRDKDAVRRALTPLIAAGLVLQGGEGRGAWVDLP
ncbi:MAG TPA: hypothetical protein VGC81_01315, partial [Candidatus Methylomirabilis sp.]